MSTKIVYSWFWMSVSYTLTPLSGTNMDSKVETVVDVNRMVRRMQNIRKDNTVAHKANYPCRVVHRKTDAPSTGTATKVISEPSRQLEVMCECDVLVVRGGPAGNTHTTKNIHN